MNPSLRAPQYSPISTLLEGKLMGKDVLKVIQIVGGRRGNEPSFLFLTLQLAPGRKRVLSTLCYFLDLKARQTNQGNWYSLTWGASWVIRLQNYLVFFFFSLLFRLPVLSLWMGRISFPKKVAWKGVAQGPAAFLILSAIRGAKLCLWVIPIGWKWRSRRERKRRKRGDIRGKESRKTW